MGRVGEQGGEKGGGKRKEEVRGGERPGPPNILA